MQFRQVGQIRGWGVLGIRGGVRRGLGKMKTLTLAGLATKGKCPSYDAAAIIDKLMIRSLQLCVCSAWLNACSCHME